MSSVLYTPGNISYIIPTSISSNKFWGPSLWKSIHVFAASYTPENREAFLSFVRSLPYLIPCAKCRQNLKKNLEILPLEPFLGSDEGVFMWSYKLHNLVNADLGKKSLPYNTAKSLYYTNLGLSCSDCR